MLHRCTNDPNTRRNWTWKKNIRISFMRGFRIFPRGSNSNKFSWKESNYIFLHKNVIYSSNITSSRVPLLDTSMSFTARLQITRWIKFTRIYINAFFLEKKLYNTYEIAYLNHEHTCYCDTWVVSNTVCYLQGGFHRALLAGPTRIRIVCSVGNIRDRHQWTLSRISLWVYWK